MEYKERGSKRKAYLKHFLNAYIKNKNRYQTNNTTPQCIRMQAQASQPQISRLIKVITFGEEISEIKTAK